MEEIRWYFLIYGAAVVLITLNLRTGANGSVGRSVADTVRLAAFQVSSVMTTTGFSTTTVFSTTVGGASTMTGAGRGSTTARTRFTMSVASRMPLVAGS